MKNPSKQLERIPGISWQLASLWIVLGFSFLGQFARIETSFGRVSVYEIALPLVSVALLWTYRRTVLTLLRTPFALICSLFLGWIVLTTFWNAQIFELPQLFTQGMAYLIRLALYLVFALGIFAWSQEKTFPKAVIQKGLLAWLLLQSIVGLGQFLLYPDTRILFYLGWDDHLSRAFGTFLDPGFFGLFMAFGVLLSFVFALQSAGKWKIASIVSLALSMASLALSYSRASYLALTAGVLVLGAALRQRSVWLLIPLLVFSLLLLPKDGGGEGQNLLRTRSIEAREEVLSYHTQGLTLREWLIGKGWYYDTTLAVHQTALEANDPGREKRIVTQQNASAVDNVYLHVLFSTGVVGLVLFASGILVLLWKIRYSPLLLAVWSTVLVHSLLSTALLYSWCILFLVLISATQAFGGEIREK